METIREFITGSLATLLPDLPFMGALLAVMFVYGTAYGCRQNGRPGFDTGGRTRHRITDASIMSSGGESPHVGGTADGTCGLDRDRARVWAVDPGSGARCRIKSRGNLRQQCGQECWHCQAKCGQAYANLGALMLMRSIG